MRSSSFPARFWGHLKTITLHKLRVTRLCFKMGLIKQGLLHDLSKYSPVEFRAGVRYFQGYRSPIDAEKEAKGYSEGWLHHKGHNKHHWEYWIDRNKQCQGLFCVEMPKRYVAEMVCDRIAACQTYQKEKYTNASPIEYFLQRIPQRCFSSIWNGLEILGSTRHLRKSSRICGARRLFKVF